MELSDSVKAFTTNKESPSKTAFFNLSFAANDSFEYDQTISKDSPLYFYPIFKLPFLILNYNFHCIFTNPP